MFNQNILTLFLNRFDSSKHHKMVSIYIKSFENHMSVCQQAVAQKECDRLKASVHDIKSLCYTIGNDACGNLAEQVEENLIDGNDDAAMKQAPDLIDPIKHIIAVLEERLATLQES